MKRNVVRLLGLLLSTLLAVGAIVSCNKRETPTPEPKTDGNKVTEASKSPSQTTECPEETTKNPEETTKKPEETTKKPEEPTQKPEEPTKKPEETTIKPEDPPKPAATVTLSQSALTLTAGEKATLTAIVKNAEGMELKWSSSAPDVVSVDNGEILAQSAGTATITVSLPNGAFATCTIQVDPKPVEIGVYIDGTLVETLTTTGKNNYRITMPEKPEDITTDHNADRYFYGWFTDPSLNTPLTEEMTFPNGGKIYGKWIPINFSDYTYTVNYGKATITGAKQTTDTIVVIPSYINSFPVVEIAADVFKDWTMIRTLIICDGIEQIGSGAFYNCNSMINVTIPNSVTSIGNRAFDDCSSMISITIPNSVTNIGDSAFSGCTGLTSITIPDGVTSIGSSAFFGCSNLTSMTLPFVGMQKDGALNTHFGYIFGASSYRDDYGNIQSKYVPSSLKAVVITGGMSISSNAFYGCSSITSITIPSSVLSIGNRVFYDCSSLTSILIPDSVTSIGFSAFYGCGGLTNIRIGNSVTSIGDSAFSYCSKLNQILVAEGNTVYHSFGNCLIETEMKILVLGCKNSVIPTDGSVICIGSYAFQGCRRLTNIIIPDSVTSISNGAFSGCNSLESITLPFVGDCSANQYQYPQYPFGYIFGDRSFEGGKKTTQYYYRSNMSSSRAKVFSTFYIPASLKSVTITGSNILYGAFSNCGNITSITIGKNVTNINNCAFNGCGNLNQILVEKGNMVYHSSGNCLIDTGMKMLILGCQNSVIPADGSVTSIGKYAFSRYDDMLYGLTSPEGVTSITIPDSVRSIDDHAFSDCLFLTSITIGDGVTSIGSYAFSNCWILKSIKFNGTIAQWNAIPKGSNWDNGTAEYTVYCTDGEIKKQS